MVRVPSFLEQAGDRFHLRTAEALVGNRPNLIEIWCGRKGIQNTLHDFKLGGVVVGKRVLEFACLSPFFSGWFLF